MLTKDWAVKAATTSGLFLAVFFVVVWLSGAILPSQAADLFGRPDQPAAQDTQPTVSPAPITPPAAPTVLPEPLRRMVAGLIDVQSRLNAELRVQARDGESWRPALAIMGISFLYGVFHAVGPGHGKMVIGSYFLTRRARLLHGLAMSGVAAFVQALSAILLVAVLAAVLDVGSRQIFDQAAILEIASYGLIMLVGLWAAWGVISGRVCCEHGDEKSQHVHEHNHEHDGPCDHHRHAPSSLPPKAGRGELWAVLSTGAVVGLRPCSGAILVLLFTLANGIFPVGILSTFVMGIGVAITVSVVSLTTLGLHHGLSKLGQGRYAVLAQRLRQAAALAGAMVITLFGAVQLWGLWHGSILPLNG